jgi:hypothetical protein
MMVVDNPGKDPQKTSGIMRAIIYGHAAAVLLSCE